MLDRVKAVLGRSRKVRREFSYGERIEREIRRKQHHFGDQPVFVETGCGLSTIALARVAKELGATAYSLDVNEEKSRHLRARFGKQLDHVHFVIGDSLANLSEIVAQHEVVHFVFLDSAASALHTFREFLAVEAAFRRGGCLLVDNAALPGEKDLLSPVRKGKIVVPYLLASPHWEVVAHPRSGDSMVAAIRHEEANFADPAYEHPDYVDNWRARFANGNAG